MVLNGKMERAMYPRDSDAKSNTLRISKSRGRLWTYGPCVLFLKLSRCIKDDKSLHKYYYEKHCTDIYLLYKDPLYKYQDESETE
jgi:hypothetical protein